MLRNRDLRRLTQNKQSKPTIGKNTPPGKEGDEGSISIRSLSDGVFLFF